LTRSVSCTTFPSMADRPRVLNVRMTDEEMAMVAELAEAKGLSQSDAVRQLVREAHAEHASARPKRPKPKPHR
jgi:hypothetical protein